MELLSYDVDELYQEVKKRALDEGAFTAEEWSDMVDQVLQDMAEFGEVHDDDELSAVKEQLKGRFAEFEREIPES